MASRASSRVIDIVTNEGRTSASLCLTQRPRVLQNNAAEVERIATQAYSQVSDLHYDPDQDRQQRCDGWLASPSLTLNSRLFLSLSRSVQQHLRKLKEKQERNVDEAARPGSTTLQELTNLSNHFYQHVRAPTEAAMDADVQVGLARMGLAKSNNLNQGMRRYEAKEFIARLRDYVQTDAGHLDWLNLGKSARFYYRRSAGLSTMYGPITVEMKERKATQRQARDVIEKAIAPDVITNTQTDQSANETSKRVIMVMKALAALHQQRRAAGLDIEFFEFVVNPNSFTQTVENIFHLSFGVKRGFAKIVKSRDGRLLVEPNSANAAADAAGADDGAGVQSHQAVVTMSIALWRHVVQELGLTEPLIDPRASVTTAEYLPESVRQDVPDEAASKKRQRTQQSQSRSKRRTQAAAADDDDEEVDELAADGDDNDNNDKDPPKTAKKTTEDDDAEDDAPPKRKKRMPAKKVVKRIADDDDDE